MKAIQVENIEMTIDSEKIIKRFAVEMLEKEEGTRFGFTEPRIMERACFVGILAQKLGKTEVNCSIKTNGHRIRSSIYSEMVSR